MQLKWRTSVWKCQSVSDQPTEGRTDGLLSRVGGKLSKICFMFFGGRIPPSPLSKISIQLSFVFCKAAQPSKERERGRQNSEELDGGKGRLMTEPTTNRFFAKRAHCGVKKISF